MGGDRNVIYGAVRVTQGPDYQRPEGASSPFCPEFNGEVMKVCVFELFILSNFKRREKLQTPSS